MAFRFNCPSCNAEREASKKIIGRRVRCPECGHVSRVPDPRDAHPAGDGDSEFDPYYQWLAIPKSEQPPNHYRLLGVSVFEPDANVIAVSSDRQMVHIKAQASGRYATLSQKLLNELAKARTCLLDPKRKRTYDESLRAEQQAEVSDTAEVKEYQFDELGLADGGDDLPELLLKDEQEVSKQTHDTQPKLTPSSGLGSKSETSDPPIAPAQLTPLPSLKPIASIVAPPIQPPAVPDNKWKGKRAAAAAPPDEPAPVEPVISLRKEREQEEAEMDMTPMVDVTFLLLIFFMVTAAFSLQKAVPMPVEKSDEPSKNTVEEEIQDNPDYVQVFIDAFNTYHITTVDWEEEAPSDHELVIKLRRAAEGSDDGKVPTKLLVTAHGDALYEKVIKVMDVGTDVGIRQIQVAMTEDDEL